jgi:hypothetical protein
MRVSGSRYDFQSVFPLDDLRLIEADEDSLASDFYRGQPVQLPF